LRVVLKIKFEIDVPREQAVAAIEKLLDEARTYAKEIVADGPGCSAGAPIPLDGSPMVGNVVVSTCS
jgi:hypothetical protein